MNLSPRLLALQPKQKESSSQTCMWSLHTRRTEDIWCVNTYSTPLSLSTAAVESKERSFVLISIHKLYKLIMSLPLSAFKTTKRPLLLIWRDFMCGCMRFQWVLEAFYEFSCYGDLRNTCLSLSFLDQFDGHVFSCFETSFWTNSALKVYIFLLKLNPWPCCC